MVSSIVRAATAAASAAMVASCLGDATQPRAFRVEDATLLSRPATPGAQAPTPGYISLGLGSQRDGFIYVPATYDHATPMPLVVLLHGASETSLQWHTDEISALADEFGVIIMAPDSRLRSWDFLNEGRFAADVVFIDGALDRTFLLCNVDPARVALAGFSDGASYALSLGLINGDLFTKVAAFSPGIVFAPVQRGQPDIFISHGSTDPVLSLANTRDNIVPLLREAGYTVEFVEFNGGHTLPLSVARSAFAWIAEATP